MEKSENSKLVKIYEKALDEDLIKLLTVRLFESAQLSIHESFFSSAPAIIAALLHHVTFRN